MNNHLRDFYFNIAIETARAEYEAVSDIKAGQVSELTNACLLPTRAKTIAASYATSSEIKHLGECRMCARLVQNFSVISVEESAPAIRRLLSALKRYGKTTGELANQWIETAKANARIFSHGIAELAFQDDMLPVSREFEIEGMSIHLELREEIDQFVIEVATADEKLYGLTVTIVLLGGTGEEQRVPVTLDGRKGGLCYGSGVAMGHGHEVIKKLGPVIVPHCEASDIKHNFLRTDDSTKHSE